VERTRPAICYWTNEKVKYREIYEKSKFGKEQLNGEYEEEEMTEEVKKII